MTDINAPVAYLVVVRGNGQRTEFATLPKDVSQGETPGPSLKLAPGESILNVTPLYIHTGFPTTDTCIICDSGTLTPITYSDVFGPRHNIPEDKEVTVHGLEAYSCNKCGCDPIYPEQWKRNELRIRHAREIKKLQDYIDYEMFDF